MEKGNTSAASAGAWVGKVAGWLVKPAKTVAGWVTTAWHRLRGPPRKKSPREGRREEKRRRKELWRKAQTGRRRAA